MDRMLVIFNPYAGRGGAARQRDKVAQALARAGLEFDIVETQRRGHGIELARTAYQQGFSTIAAAGGDGTVSEVLNGIAQATSPGNPVGRVALLPIGTGNDLADSIGYPRNLDVASATIARGQTCMIDMGHARLRSSSAEFERYFGNNMGLGFEAQVTMESYRIERVGGTMRYLLAALRALQSYPTPRAEIQWQHESGHIDTIEQAILLVTIGNTPRTGGVFYLTPDAIVDDGLFDVGIAGSLPRRRVLTLLPKALVGKHKDDPAVDIVRCRKLTVRCSEALPVHLDGEVVMEDAVEVVVEVEPSRLEIVV